MVGTGDLAKGAVVGEGMGLATGNPYGAAIGAGRAIIKHHREDKQKYQQELAEEQQAVQQRESQLQAYQRAVYVGAKLLGAPGRVSSTP